MAGIGIAKKGLGLLGKKKTSWQERRIGAMNRIIKKHPNIPGWGRKQTERFIDEYGKVSDSKAKTKKEYKSKK